MGFVIMSPGPIPVLDCYVYSKKSLSFRDRVGWRNFRNAFASIWRILSRVTPNSRPTSSKVRLRPSSRPNRSCSTRASRSVKVCSTSATCSFSSWKEAASAGARAFRSSMKSPRWESSSSPIGVSKETGSWEILRISSTFSGPISMANPISSGVGSRPYS